MQELFLTFSPGYLSSFFSGFFWIDLCVICLITLLVYYAVIRRSRSIVKRNTLYNAELLKFRTEVYHFYEKNFFTS